jgi:hypothetical protein
MPLVAQADGGAAQTATVDSLTATADTPSTTTPSSPTPTPTITATPTGHATITTIVFDPPDPLAEYVQIQNTSGAPLDMAGWTLRDVANNTYTFPAFSLATGASVRVWTNSGANDAANLFWGRSSAVWNNTGDTAYLRDAQGALVAQYSY